MYFIVSIFLLNFALGESYDFNRSSTGVTFSAYIHKNVRPDSITDWETYSLNDLKTMMKVMSGRFSKISTFGVGSGKDPEYQWNSTYYRSFSQIYSGEAAALINKEIGSTSQNPIVLYLGIWLHSHPQQVEMEVKLALESANKSNLIFPKTVQALIISQSDLGSNANTTKMALEILKDSKIKGQTARLGLKLGTRQNCDGLSSQDTENPTPLTVDRIEIVKMSDFIICEVNPVISLGAENAFAGVKTKLVQYKNDLKAINSQIEVMGQTGTAGRVGHSWEVEVMQKYWQVADKWAEENEFTMWMSEALDNPWKMWDESAGHFGWWKLTDDAKTGVVEGYLEKVEDLKAAKMTTTARTTTTKKPQQTKDRHESKPGKKNGATKGSCGMISFVGTVLAVIVIKIFV